MKSQEAVHTALTLARDRGHQRLEPKHLLGLFWIRAAGHPHLVIAARSQPAQVLRAAEEGPSPLPKVSGGEQSLGPDLAAALDTAQAEAERMKDQYVSVEHLAWGW